MKEYIEEYMYNELDFITKEDLQTYVNFMLQYDFDVTSIGQSNIEKAITLFESLIEQHPRFLAPYEDFLRLMDCLESHPVIDERISTITTKWITSCLELINKEKLENKHLPWGWLENRSLMRGVYADGQQKWEAKQFDEANKQFRLLLKMNPDDNIGARFSEKATRLKMTSQEFERRFIKEDESGSFYVIDDLTKWFEQ